ncbi:MAG: hypothetical protein JW795_22705 [Chitinivibrionales bacterium]|nr:hypothetical protein [Chitinivibrionales bacterium]
MKRLLNILDFLTDIISLAAAFLLVLHIHPIAHYAWLKVNVPLNMCMIVICVNISIHFLARTSFASYLKNRWFDIPCLLSLFTIGWSQFSYTPGSLIVMLYTISCMLITRGFTASFFFSQATAKPSMMMIGSFLLTIYGGTLLLLHPVSFSDPEGITFIDALFTSTSATCVTGLTVQDTGSYFTLPGQIVIMVLMQIGGLGIMSFSVLLLIVTGRKMNIRQRIVMGDMLIQENLSQIGTMVKVIFLCTFGSELIGAVILTFLWYPQLDSVYEAFYYGLFHAVAAFCNAGFCLYPDSLIRYRNCIGTNIVISSLVILGGLGFIVYKDFFDHLRFSKQKRSVTRPYRIQTKIIMNMTIALIVIGTLLFFLFEKFFMFGKELRQDTILVSFFQSVSARTAGFNTCDIGQLAPETAFILILLMLIGGSPGSTGGGIKTTTAAILLFSLRASLRQKEEIELFRRTISFESLHRALTIFLFYIIFIILFVFLLLVIEEFNFLDILFETVSAIATVGLSRGITPQLSDSGKFLITILMFIGRLGPLTLMYALLFDIRKSNYRYAEEHIALG